MKIQRAAYQADLQRFQIESEDAILGQLAQSHLGDLTPAQREAWAKQISILKRSTQALSGGMVLFEYLIPRMGKRADNVLLIGNTVLVIEFKVSATNYERNAVKQAIDYALDLKNFHGGSKEMTIVPILVAAQARECQHEVTVATDGVSEVISTNAEHLSAAIRYAASLGSGSAIDHHGWIEAGYQPTPTIIEASQALYRGHAVTDITRFEAGADNLGATTTALCHIIDNAKSRGEKAICFVTGVPGAGKTLAGLNLTNERRKSDTNATEHAVFLSGNGPLVKVLQESLARDAVKQANVNGESKAEALRKAKAFIQNIHHFRDECIRNPAPPTERVVVFDEAQRAWNREQTSKFMQQKRGHGDFDLSEPNFLIGAMDRHSGWAVIVCLVGGGQEINTGEAGIEEWLRALRDHYPHWSVHLPSQLQDLDYLPTLSTNELGSRVTHNQSLHLGVSIRSFRSEQLSAGIDSLLTGSSEIARQQLESIRRTYPICITRSLTAAKTWVRRHARGSERFGLLASSGARRLRPLSIFASGVQGNECNWFLNDDLDVRSSYYLEDAASEFEVQGLELDWTIVVWDGDLIRSGANWLYRAFKGTRWQAILKEDTQRYRLNAYRVLLTRARQGTVIVVPEGDSTDLTRLPEFYDPTWNYLTALGLDAI